MVLGLLLLFKVQIRSLSFFWESKTQRAVSRSTREAEFVALGTALFGGAISLLAVSQGVIASTYVFKAHEDNQAVLAGLCRSVHMF